MKKVFNILILLIGTIIFGLAFTVALNIQQPLSYIPTLTDYVKGQGISWGILTLGLLLDHYLLKTNG